MVDRYVKPGGYGATVRVILFDFKKAFDLINHQIRISTYDIPKDVIFWITDFLTSRKQRAKRSHNYFSEWGAVLGGGVPQGIIIIVIKEMFLVPISGSMLTILLFRRR